MKEGVGTVVVVVVVVVVAMVAEAVFFTATMMAGAVSNGGGGGGVGGDSGRGSNVQTTGLPVKFWLLAECAFHLTLLFTPDTTLRMLSSWWHKDMGHLPNTKRHGV